ARACGCFAPPDPSVPVLQADEQILFSHADGKVHAIIQIQYQGAASDFGWLLPLPSVPEFDVASEEIFAQLYNATQPKYRLNQVAGDSCNFGRGQGGTLRTAAEDAFGAGSAHDNSVVVKQGAVGPYGYAVLHADSKDEMFKWLSDNHYFIPTGTEDVSAPYI